MKLLDSHLSTQSLQLRSSSDGFNLDVQLCALPQVIHDQATSLTTLAQSLNLAAPSSDSDVWNARQEYFNRTESLLVKIAMLPSDIVQITTAVHALSGTSVTQATGIMTASIPVAASTQLLELRRNVEATRGSLTIVHQPAETILDPWGTPPDTLPLMRELKQRFDPNRILNPGRFLGGI
jgi:glycolate oxidase FAD binding subunit